MMNDGKSALGKLCCHSVGGAKNSKSMDTHGYHENYMRNMYLHFDCIIPGLGFSTEEDLEKFLHDSDSCVRTQVLAALVVTSPFNDGKLAQEVVYKLRPISEKRIGGRNVTSVLEWNTDASFMGFGVTGPRAKNSPRGGSPGR